MRRREDGPRGAGRKELLRETASAAPIRNAGREEETTKLKVLIHAAKEGGFWAEVPALPGCFTQGESLEEIRANIHELAEGWLEVASERQPNADIDPAPRAEEIDL